MPAQSISATLIKIKKILHPDGTSEEFSLNKIADSIFSAAKTVGGKDKELAVSLAHEIVSRLNEEIKEETIPAEKLREIIEHTLLEKGHVKTARAHIELYHEGQRKEKEEAEKEKEEAEKENKENKEKEGIKKEEKNLAEENMLFSPQALRILERRYLLKDETGNLTETPQKMLRRVAKNIAHADTFYGAESEQAKETEETFYRMMAELRFLPNSPTLMNAGTKVQQISSCFVLPIEDDINSIFLCLKEAAQIHQRGSGTGFSFTPLRPKGDPVKRNLGVAAGPLAFLKIYDTALEAIKQGGVRPGANMAVLRVDHPDIIRFIESKRDGKSLKNFNISVAVTDNFMRAVEADREYYLTNPRTEKYVGRLRAKDVFAMITQNAWKTGDPGLLFIDEINRKHPAKHLGEIQTTNQCGEAPLLPYEGIVLGSLNLNKFVDEEKKEINWDMLKETVHAAVHFLDNVIDKNIYPSSKVEQATKNTRKFGLGVMGLADLLCKLKVRYDSEEGLKVADELMSFIKETAYEKSMQLAEKRGVCPAWNGSDHQRLGRKMRNISCLSIAPTGTISLLADASSGCEPLFAVSYQRTMLGDNELIYLDKTFEKVAREREFYSPELIRRISFAGSIQEIKEIPKDVREVFVTAQDISPEGHINMQAALQKYVDNSISKTINFPKTAAIKDVENAYLLAWKAKCKGITIYRDGSYEDQVITVGE